MGSLVERFLSLHLWILLFYRVSSQNTDCPLPTLNSQPYNFNFDECPVKYKPGCTVRMQCEQNFIPSSSNFPNMQMGPITCGDDLQWRDASGKVLDLNDPVTFLTCVGACYVPISAPPYFFSNLTSPSTLATFNDPYNNNKPLQFMLKNDYIYIVCNGTRVGFFQHIEYDKKPLMYRCTGSNQFSALIEGRPGQNCRQYCNGSTLFFDSGRQVKRGSWNSFYNTTISTNSTTYEMTDGGRLDFQCLPGYAYPPGTALGADAIETLFCDATTNMLFNKNNKNQSQSGVSPCIATANPGECFQLDTSNVDIVSNVCVTTSMGVTSPCKMTVKCKPGFYPTRNQFLNGDGNQELSCLSPNGWSDQFGPATSVLGCTQGCYSSVYNTTQGVFIFGSSSMNISATCTNLTFYNQPPPRNTYYCPQKITADCVKICPNPPLPEGVQMIITPNNTNMNPPFDLLNAVFAGNNMTYTCLPGYAYPPDSIPAQNGNMQRTACILHENNISYISDLDTNQRDPPIVPCTKVTDCKALSLQPNTVQSNNSGCQLTGDSYNSNCYLKYDCVSSYSPTDNDYVLGDGQDLICQNGKWFNPTKNQYVDQVMTCKENCTEFNVQMLNLTNNANSTTVTLTNYLDTAGNTQNCISSNNSQGPSYFFKFLNSTNKYICNFNIIKNISHEIIDSQSSCSGCLPLPTSPLPANLSLVGLPANFTTNVATFQTVYISPNTSYVFKCMDGTHVSGQQPDYLQHLECHGNTLYENKEKNIVNANISSLEPCIPLLSCGLNFTNSSTTDLVTTCVVTNGQVNYNCSVTLKCKPGFFPVQGSGASNSTYTVVCGVSRNNSYSWNEISIGMPMKPFDCEPGYCPVSPPTTTVDVTSNCAIVDGFVQSNCTVTEKCKPGYSPMDLTGVSNGQKVSTCNGTTSKDGVLINIIVGQPVPALKCAEDKKCAVTNTSNSYYITTSCAITDGSVNLGCNVTEICRNGFYPTNMIGVSGVTRTVTCNSTKNADTTWVSVSLGTPVAPYNCSPPCNITALPGTILNTSTCEAVQNGWKVGCNATVICETGLVPINITLGRKSIDMQCRSTGVNQSTFIDLVIGQPVQLFTCGCPDPRINNNSQISGTCFLPGAGGAPGCNATETCAPGTAPIWGSIGSGSSRTLTCLNNTITKNYTWIDISIGVPAKPLECAPKCPNITVPHVHWRTDCVYQPDSTLSGYQAKCNAVVECDDGHIGSNVLYNYSSTVNATCKDLGNGTSIFIEISTGQPIKDLCERKCDPLNITNANATSNCYLTNGAAENCTVDLVCLPGTIPIYVGWGENSTTTVRCERKNNKNATWVDISTGQEKPTKDCRIPCNFSSVPHMTNSSSCMTLNGTYPVGCPITLQCEDGYIGINVKYGRRSVLTINCTSVDNKTSIFYEVSTGKPLTKDDICGVPPPTEAPIVCGPTIETNATQINSMCYIWHKGSSLGCDVNVTCIPGMYPIYMDGKGNATTIKCAQKANTQISIWIDVTTGDEFKYKNCSPACKTPTLEGTKFTTICVAVEPDGYQVNCSATLRFLGYTPIDIGSGVKPLYNLTCTNVNSQNSTFVDITTGQPITKSPCTSVCAPLVPGANTTTSSNCILAGGTAPLGCDVDVICLPGLYPIFIKPGTSFTTKIQCNRTSTGKVTWVDISTGAEYKPTDCGQACSPVVSPGIIFNTTCIAVPTGGYQLGCNGTLQCAEGYTPINIGSGSKWIANLACKGTVVKNSTFVDISTGQPVTGDACAAITTTAAPLTCPPLPEGSNTIISSTCYIAGAPTPLNCDANVTCITGTYPVLVSPGKDISTPVKCQASGTGTANWIDISIGQLYSGKNCSLPCEPVTYPGTIFSSTCVALPSGQYQVGCNATLTCDQGYIPVNVENVDNWHKDLQCISVNSKNSTFIEISTGQPVKEGPCIVRPKCNFLVASVGPATSVTFMDCSDPNDIMTGIPSLVFPIYAFCRFQYMCVNSSFVPLEYGGVSGTKIPAYCNITNDKQVIVNANTGEEMKDLKCTIPTAGVSTTTTVAPPTGCSELFPPNGAVQTNQSCSASSNYALGCRKQLECAEVMISGSNSPKYIYECKNINGKPQWVDPTTNAAISTLVCPTKSGCSPIVTSNTTFITNKTCTPFGNLIHPENCKVDVECLFGYYPSISSNLKYPKHTAECILNPSENYEWLDRTTGQWWNSYDCTKGCLNQTGPTTQNQTIFKNGTVNYSCTVTYYANLTGKYYCNQTNVATAVCNNTCQELQVNPSLTIESEPIKIMEQLVVIGGQYDVYCPDGQVWKGTTSSSKKFICSPDGKYTSGPETGITVVVNTCEKPTTPSPNCTLVLQPGQEVKGSTCDVGDTIYAGGCIVEIQCKNRTYPSTQQPSQSQLCATGPDGKGTWVDPITKGPLTSYPCPDGCLPPSSIVKNSTTITSKYTNATITCVISRVNPKLIKYWCNKTVSVDPLDPIVDVSCNYVCPRIGLDSGLTNTNTWPNLYYDKVIVTGITEIQCPPGTVFNETGNRQQNFTCMQDSTYSTPSKSGITLVINTCVNDSIWIGNVTNETGCSPIPIDTTTIITNRTCVPFTLSKKYPEDCIVDVICKDGYYPEKPEDRNRGEHKAQCRYNGSTFYWYDTTISQNWVPTKCTNECIAGVVANKNTTTITVGGIVYVCTIEWYTYQTGKYYCDNSTNDVKNATCNNTCPALIVNSPLVTVRTPLLILGKVIPYGGQYEVHCPPGECWKGTKSTSKNYTCMPDNKYNDGTKGGLLEAEDTCEPATTGVNCTYIPTEGVEVTSPNCDVGDFTYELGCVIDLRCKNGTYPIDFPYPYLKQECTEQAAVGVWKKLYPSSRSTVDFKCSDNSSSCLNLTDIQKNNTVVTKIINGVTVICNMIMFDPKLKPYLCPGQGNLTYNCTNTCPILGIDAGLNKYYSPKFYREKIVIGDYYTIECPTGTVWPSTGSRLMNYTCNPNGLYNSTAEYNVVFVKNSCIDSTAVTPSPPTTPSGPPPPPAPGCENIVVDPSTSINNKTCVPFNSGIHAEWCIIDVVCKNGTYPEVLSQRTLPEHKVQCQLQGGKFIWYDLTLNGVWNPYKCLNGCLNETGPVISNKTYPVVDGVTYACDVTMRPHKTGRYYCNGSNVVSASCNSTCPPLKVPNPLVTPTKLVYIYGKLVATGTAYDVYCNANYAYNETGVSVKHYTCQNGAYTDGIRTGLFEAIDSCVCINSNCTLTTDSTVVVTNLNCQPNGAQYEYGCTVKLTCIPGYRPKGVSRLGSIWTTQYFQIRQCANTSWIDPKTKFLSSDFTCEKDCLNENGFTKNCWMEYKTAVNGANVSCEYCNYDPAINDLLCPNATKVNGIQEVCCNNVCRELLIGTGLNKRHYATLIFKDKVAIGDYYTVECPTGQIFLETGTRGQNFTCTPNGLYNSNRASNISFVPNSCINVTTPTPTTPTTTCPLAKGCDILYIDSTTLVRNITCTPMDYNIYPDNCIQEVSCKKGLRPETSGYEKFAWHSVECLLDSATNVFYWYDNTIGIKWNPYKCVNGCINATTTFTNSTTVAIKNLTFVCTEHTVAYKTGDYYCNASGDTIWETCNRTCPKLIVNPPLQIGKYPNPMVYKHLVLVNGVYVVVCPGGKQYNGSCASIMNYTCQQDGTYSTGDKTGFLQAVDTCVDVTSQTPNCSLSLNSGVIVSWSTCLKNPIKQTETYQVSCVIDLACLPGWHPKIATKIEQYQYCNFEQDTSQSFWYDIATDDRANSFECEKGCIDVATVTKSKTETVQVKCQNVTCTIKYMDPDLISLLCDNSTVNGTNGEISRICTNVCNPLIMDKGMTYVPPSPEFIFESYHFVLVLDKYTVQCPSRQVYCDTGTRTRVYTCDKGGLYNTTNQSGLTIALNTCVDRIETTTPIITTANTCPMPDQVGEGTIIYNITCTGTYPSGCTASYTCRQGYYPVRIEDQKLLNRTALCSSSAWVESTNPSQIFVPWTCARGCINDTTAATTVTKSTTPFVFDTTICCNTTWLVGQNRRWYCNFTMVKDISCTETCQPLVYNSPIWLAQSPDKIVENKLVFRGSRYILACPENQVFQGSNDSIRNYTCDYNGLYYCKNGENIQTVTDFCIPAVKPPTSAQCALTANAESNCVSANGKFNVSCFVKLNCLYNQYPAVPEDQLYYQRLLICTIFPDGSVDWLNVRSGQKGYSPEYTCKDGCMTSTPSTIQASGTIDGTNMVCNVSTIPAGAVPYQCNRDSIRPDGTVLSICTQGCKDLVYNVSIVSADTPTEYYYYVSRGANYTLYCPPGMIFTGTSNMNSLTFICGLDGTYSNSFLAPSGGISTVSQSCSFPGDVLLADETEIVAPTPVVGGGFTGMPFGG